MIHTAMLTYDLPYSRKNILVFEKFIKQPGSEYHRQYKKWYNQTYRDQGIRVIAYQLDRPGYKGIVFKCRINFKRLIEQEDKVSIYAESDKNQMIKRFNEIMKALNLKTWNTWKANRIDYCINVRTPYVKEYVKLMQKGDIPYYQRMAYDKETRNKGHKPGSLYLPAKVRDKRKRKTGSQTINFYDKYDQRVKEGATGEDLEQARNVLRLEVQCLYPKLRYIKKKNMLPDMKIERFLSAEICADVLEKAVKGICHMGDYYRRSEALKIIDQSRYHESTKNVLKMILNEVAKQYRSIAKVREQFIEDGMSRDQFRLFMNRFDELGINAVTISDNKHLDQKSLKEGLPGVYELFVDALTDSLSVEDSDSLVDDLKEAEPDISVELK